MNPAVFGSLPTTCPIDPLSAQGPNGPDQVTFIQYDITGNYSFIYPAYGTPSQQYVRFVTYSNNGLLTSFQDARGNLTTYEYDGFDRLSKIRFPSLTTHGTSSTTDYERYGYDANSNVTSDRRRDGNTITTTYDNLNRATFVDAPTGTPDVTYAYDNFGRMISVSTSSQTLTYAFDQLSRLTSETNSAFSGSVAYQYDLAGERTRVTWPDSFYAQYDYDLTGATTAIRENGATSGAGVLTTYAYDNLGRRSTITRGDGVTSTYSYDGNSRLSSLAHDLASTGWDQTLLYSYSAANQQLTRNGTNTSYLFQRHCSR